MTTTANPPTATLIAGIHAAAPAEDQAMVASIATATALDDLDGIHTEADGTYVTVTVTLGPITHHISSQGARWASTVVAGVELQVFPTVFAVYGTHVVDQATVRVTGRVDLRAGGAPLLTVHTINPIGDPR